MWIDESETVPALQVLESHHFDQGRFAGTGLADDVYVRKAIIVLNAEQAIVIAKINPADVYDRTALH